MSTGLSHALHFLRDYHARGELNIPERHYSPGFWAALAAYARRAQLGPDAVILPTDNLKGYASAVGLSGALGGEDDYTYGRHREGINYSRLTHLSSPEAVDTATATINGCIRNFFAGRFENFVVDLCEVVGELHDNVWSHGLNSGFSMAQRTKVPYHDDYALEFALADCGMGFRATMLQAGIPAPDDQTALKWCIQKGHTSKAPPEDEWAQQLPGDALQNPFAGAEVVRVGHEHGNHHQGLGLHKLMKLRERFSGQVLIASGGKLLFVNRAGAKYFYDVPGWQGVAIACKFKESEFENVAAEPEDPTVAALMRRLIRNE